MQSKTIQTQAGKYRVHVTMSPNSNLTCTDLDNIRKAVRDRMFVGTLMLVDGTKASWKFIRQPRYKQISFLGGL